jgi:tetratricopeptide (TPR) repeat protein
MTTNQATVEQAIEALYATGHWLLGQERFADAADVFRAMATAKPEDERAWLGLGQAHESARQRIIAKEMYVTGVTLAHGGRCAIALARVLREMGNDADASEAIDFAEMIAKDNDDDALAALVAYERGES